MSQDTVNNNWRKPWLCVCRKRIYLHRSSIVKSQRNRIELVTRPGLVQLFEYMMRNLYEPPKQLLDQVQHNIFKRQPNSAVKYFSAGGRAFGCQKTSSKFYSLYPIVETFSNDSRQSPEVPKLDGLACSFILGTPDSLDYNLLYQSLVDLIQVCLIFYLRFL